MLDNMVECLVKRNITTVAIFQRAGMIFLDVLVAVVLFILGGYFPSFLMLFVLLIGIMVFLTWLVFKNTDVEYEYQFFEGSLRVDKIMHRASRKKLRSFDMSKMDYMAPVGSRHHGGLASQRKMFDFSANDENVISYIAVVHDGDDSAVDLKFTPDEELLTALSMAYPRKVYRD